MRQADIMVEDIEHDPRLITEHLLRDEDVSVLLEKRGEIVHLAYLRRYDRDVTRILQDAKRELDGRGPGEYSREQAFRDLTEALDEIRTDVE